ncbi:MAG TPA: cell division protein ZapA [Terriglobales bacterium]|nr:cell division protein ZapA [Terriglobales bacterium]
MAPASSTRVEIFDQGYAIGGDDAAYIRSLAARVDAKMRQVARETRVVDSLKVAIMAAINLADESESLRRRVEQLEREVGERARALSRDLDRLLDRAG